jgi:hypothetical protein
MTDHRGVKDTTAPIAPGLWIGVAYAPLPASTSVVVTLDDLVTPIEQPGVSEARHPFPDSRWHAIDHVVVRAAIDAADTPTGHVFIRCRHGINRSALIAALLLHARGWSAGDAIDTIRRAQPEALTNPDFRDLIRRWPHDPMAPQGRMAWAYGV